VPTPPEVVDALESVVDIYFSGVRHRERAAFILCDNLVEMACKIKARQYDHSFDMRCNFPAATRAPGLRLTRALRSRIESYRSTRNSMQHASAAATVDAQHCATAIMDAVEVIERCWPNTREQALGSWLRCALRVVRLYSSDGDAIQRVQFEQCMTSRNWRGAERGYAHVDEMQIQLGRRTYWGLALRMRTMEVEDCLNELGVS
jgi:hypothetical protein